MNSMIFFELKLLQHLDLYIYIDNMFVWFGIHCFFLKRIELNCI